MTDTYALGTSVVIDRRAAPLLADIQKRSVDPTIADVRAIARRLRMLRPAWRAVTVTIAPAASDEVVEPASLRHDGDLLRVDVRVLSRVPLIDASADSAADARAKLEALSDVFVGDVVELKTRIYPTALACDRALLRVDPWPEHWFCACGAISPDEVPACARCGRPRSPVGEGAFHSVAAAA